MKFFSFCAGVLYCSMGVIEILVAAGVITVGATPLTLACACLVAGISCFKDAKKGY